MLPVKEIRKPTPFDIWKNNPTFFPPDATETQTHVVNGPPGAKPPMRYAYGLSKKPAQGFYFYVAMTPDQEPEFWRLYLDWARKQPDTSTHDFKLAPLVRHPPTCGTPDTPPCPPGG